MEGGHEHEATLGALAGGVTQSIDDSGQGPASAERGSGDGVLQAGDQEGSEERGVVLSEVGVGTLGWAEESVS